MKIGAGLAVLSGVICMILVSCVDAPLAGDRSEKTNVTSNAALPVPPPIPKGLLLDRRVMSSNSLVRKLTFEDPHPNVDIGESEGRKKLLLVAASKGDRSPVIEKHVGLRKSELASRSPQLYAGLAVLPEDMRLYLIEARGSFISRQHPRQAIDKQFSTLKVVLRASDGCVYALRLENGSTK